MEYAKAFVIWMLGLTSPEPIRFVWLDTVFDIIALVAGFVLFIAYRLFRGYVFRTYGGWYLFYHWNFRIPEKGEDTQVKWDELRRRFEARRLKLNGR